MCEWCNASVCCCKTATMLHYNKAVLHCNKAMYRCNTAMLRCNIIMLYCNTTMLHCDTTMLHCDITMLHCDITMLNCTELSNIATQPCVSMKCNHVIDQQCLDQPYHRLPGSVDWCRLLWICIYTQGDIRTYFIHREIYVCTLYTGDIRMYIFYTQEIDTVRCTRACVSDWWEWYVASVSVRGLAAVLVGVLYHVWVPAVGNTAGGHSAMWHDIEDEFCHNLESVYCGFWPHVLEKSIYTARHSNTVFASGITNST